jgi:acyl-CoA synthetase (AMP-forming)/AMP-acid ligase II
MSHSVAVRKGISSGVIFADGIRAASARTPGKAALLVGTQAISFAALANRIDRFSNLIHSGQRIAPGQRVGIIASNRMEYVEVVCGASSAGVALTTVGPAASGPEIAYICSDDEPQALFVDPELEELARAHAGDRVKHVIPFGPVYEDLLLSAADTQCPVAVDETDVFCIPL